MNVVTYTRSPRKVKDGTKTCSFEELLKTSDIVSLHCPLTDDNAKMINSQALSIMKPEAILINTARGRSCGRYALADALKNDVIAGACVDTLTYEPMREDCPLRNAKNCVITPHIAWAAKRNKRTVA